MLQPAFSDCLFLDLLSHLQDFRASSVVDVGGRQIAQALVVAMVVVVIDEGADLAFQVAGQEVDRGTEPKTSPTKRKSWKRSIDQYRQVFDHQLHERHYGLKANLIICWVFTSKAKEARFLDLLRNHIEPGGLPVLTASLPQSGNGSPSPGVWTRLFTQAWQRATGDPVLISNG